MNLCYLICVFVFLEKCEEKIFFLFFQKGCGKTKKVRTIISERK